VYPLGALSLNGGGTDIAEYIDMFKAGAVGFSDGLKPCQDAGLLLRALTYVKTFEGLIIHHPEDKTLRGKGLMHEGLVSTSLGLMGVPVLAEVVALQRDLMLREYADSKLLVHAVSAADSLQILKKAREKSEKVFVSASYLNLIATDENVRGFHSLYKVKPVLRSETDRDALLQAVKEDIIDVIVSNHVPVDEDGKKVEFPYAESGAGGIETAFIATLDALAEKMDIGHLVSKFNDRPREILGLPPASVIEGQRADICIFERGTTHVFDKSLSLSANNPLLNHTFRSRVIGSVLGDNLVLA
jgi:dihydroorotase